MKIKTDKLTGLRLAVAELINEEDHSEGIEGYLKDLAHGGCQSGMVSELIYTADCVIFYMTHREEIGKLLGETLENFDMPGPVALFGDKWLSDDPLALDDQNQNLLAWFAYEQVAHDLAIENGIIL